MYLSGFQRRKKSEGVVKWPGWFGMEWPICGQKYAIFDHIWHLGKFLAYNFQILLWNLAIFGPPHRGWDLWFSLRPSVRPYVRPSVRTQEISKSVHRNFLIFGRKLGLPNATEVTFSVFGRKIPFWRFWPFYVKKWPFLAKNQHFSQYLKIGS